MSSSVFRNSADLRIKRSFSFTLAFKFLASWVAVLHAILFSTIKSHQCKMHITLRHDHISCDLRNMQFHPHMYCFSSTSTPVVLELWDSFISCSNTSVLKHSPHDGGKTHNPAYIHDSKLIGSPSWLLLTQIPKSPLLFGLEPMILHRQALTKELCEFEVPRLVF